MGDLFDKANVNLAAMIPAQMTTSQTIRLSQSDIASVTNADNLKSMNFEGKIPVYELLLESPRDTLNGKFNNFLDIFGEQNLTMAQEAVRKIYDPETSGQGCGIDLSDMTGVTGIKVGGKQIVFKPDASSENLRILVDPEELGAAYDNVINAAEYVRTMVIADVGQSNAKSAFSALLGQLAGRSAAVEGNREILAETLAKDQPMVRDAYLALGGSVDRNNNTPARKTFTYNPAAISDSSDSSSATAMLRNILQSTPFAKGDGTPYIGAGMEIKRHK